MSAPIILAYFGAAGIAMTSALFGVGIARVLWAEDLHNARHIVEIRDRIEASLRKTIAAQTQTEASLRRAIGIQTQTIEILRSRCGDGRVPPDPDRL